MVNPSCSLLRLSWILLGSALALAVLFIAGAVAILQYRDAPPTPSADQQTAHSAPAEPLPAAPTSAPTENTAHADNEDRILGSGLHPPPEHQPFAAPQAAPPLPPPAEKKIESPPKVDEKKNPSSAPPPLPPVRVDPDAAIRKRLRASEEDLRKQLLAVPELRLFSDLEIQSFRSMETTAERQAKGVSRSQVEFAYNVKLNQAMRKAATNAGLPVQSGSKCQLDPVAATIVQTLSKDLRDMGFVSVPGTPVRVRFRSGRVANVGATTIAGGSPPEKIEAFKQWCDQNQVGKFRGALATLLQMLQVEDAPTRLVLVRELAKVNNAAATAVLAKRAVMDLSEEVRKAAVAALQKRPASQYVPVLMNALRYPWPPVADHAAAALVALKSQDAVPKLIDMLDQPNPCLPLLDKKTNKRTVRELVRLNHLRNCLLCHAPSANQNDGLVRGLVPTPGQPLPRLYYAGQSGNFARADITFLRQDFSVNLPVETASKWPNEQRFDFVTRLRNLKPEEMPEIAGKANDYPQREAVRYALRGLTGKDAGDSSAKWRDIIEKKKDTAPSLEKIESNASPQRKQGKQ